MKRIISVLLPTLIFSTGPMAEELPSGDQIARNINARDEGQAVSRLLTMELTDADGKTRVRKTKGFRKYYGAEKRSVIYYLDPANIKGSVFLTYDYPETGTDDDQWLYLPALRKVRRISASDRGDYFLGTDFTYEDIKLESRISLDDYSRKIVGESEVDGTHCLLVESVPVSEAVAEELGYGRIEQCVDDAIWIVRQSKMWDVQGNPLKTVNFRDIRQVQGIWTQHELEVVNHKTGHRTRFVFSEVNYRDGVDDGVFSQEAMKRGLW
ncbi:MAG: outer membrane lipoprotein-sorting protein [Gammaproteobacteria bacterium]